MGFSIADKVVLVAGASRGLGLEFVRQIAAKPGTKVLATARDPSKATDVTKLASKVYALDITSTESIDLLAKSLKADVGHVDLVINNAGIYTRQGRLGELRLEEMVADFTTNTVGPLLLTQALVKEGVLGGTTPSLLAILTSKMGSIADNGSGGSYAYRASKAAVNAVAKSLSIDLKGEDVTVTLLHPGFVRTDMTGGRGLIDVPESVSGMLSVLESDEELDARFTAYDGKLIPW